MSTFNNVLSNFRTELPCNLHLVKAGVLVLPLLLGGRDCFSMIEIHEQGIQRRSKFLHIYVLIYKIVDVLVMHYMHYTVCVDQYVCSNYKSICPAEDQPAVAPHCTAE